MGCADDVDEELRHYLAKVDEQDVDHVTGARSAELLAAFATDEDPLQRAVSQPVSRTGDFGA